MRVLAVDWSGARRGDGKRNTWLAEVVGGRIVRLENGRTREEVAQHLIAEARRDTRVVVGLDFAFSLPIWFLEERGFASARELWKSGGAGRAVAGRVRAAVLGPDR